jgi:hypothetical protein
MICARPCRPIGGMGISVSRMHSDFYATMAQVLPLLLLALIWNSAYLDRLRGQSRRKRSEDPAGVRFWTKPRVRAYTLFVAAVVVTATTITIFELGGMIPDSIGLRIALTIALVVVLGTLTARIYFDVMAATAAEASDTIDKAQEKTATQTNDQAAQALQWCSYSSV